ncbi:TBC-domain-containing protein [Mycena indigotica]|uniref:TBC-domain-containing protein n=1 Tax=Mycena indigotica TaxID=2126181 RepID=A0A8H6W6J0_9AGAR|nr:TBC-domain-containing protein [Mycena indigotica]KAF7303468.1 TBC-domain-containing protein [Mycena indigotica]
MLRLPARQCPSGMSGEARTPSPNSFGASRRLSAGRIGRLAALWARPRHCGVPPPEDCKASSPAAAAADARGWLSLGAHVSTINATRHLHNLSKARVELEQGREALKEKEAARRERAEALVNELQIVSEREVARRVIQSVFTDDDEEKHHVKRQQSFLFLKDSLTEALEDDVFLPRSLPKEEPATPTPIVNNTSA